MAELLERLSAALAGHYRVERELGRGGMGVVLLAHDVRHDRKVAVKVLLPDGGPSVNPERFLREIRVTAALQHPNILPLLDSGECDGMMYYVMPFVAGESLRDRLDRQHQLPVDEAVQIAREIADALAYAHSRGFVHRDIKPENILLGAGHALLADFGIAHLLVAAGEKLTVTGFSVGTPDYMSPEQATGAFDHRTDIYALACVLYEMLAGTTPFSGTFQVVMARKSAEPPPGLRVVRDTVPLHVEQAILKALARVPADRFSTGKQFADALAGDSRALGISPASRASRRRWMAAGAVGALMLSGGLYVLIAGRPFADSRDLTIGATYVPLTTDPGVEWFPSISPDGQWVVYGGEQDGNRDIYLQSVTGQKPIDLTQDSPAVDDQPAFSPDGERIAFRSSRDGGGIFVMGRTGEAVRRITDRGFRPTWSPDGKQIAFVTENVEINPGNSEGVSQLWVADVNTGAKRRLQSGDAMQPAWSPHGQRIVYGRRLGTPAVGDIYTIDASDGEPVAVTSDAARDWSPTWSPDGRYVYFSSDRGGSMNLWRVAVDERTGKPRGAPEPLTTPATILAHPSFSRDGKRIAYASAQSLINIDRIELDPASGSVRGPPVSVTTGSRQFSTPDPSPDGEFVAYYTLTQPEGDIYVSRPDGSQRRAVTSDTAIDRMPRWSPDGQWLSFFSNRGGVLQLWRIRPDGSDLRRITTRRSAYGAWSPDGKHLAAVVGTRGVGDTLAVLDPFAPDDQQPMVLSRGNVGRFFVNNWSPDGRRLVGWLDNLGPPGRGVDVFDIASGTFELVSEFGEWPVWLPDSRRILFVANGNSFYVLDSRTKQLRKIFEEKRDVIGPPRLTRDGRWAFFTRRVTQSDIWLLTLARRR